ncbi:MAG: glycosyltransferase family 4 protein [Bacteroidota bacterium]
MKYYQHVNTLLGKLLIRPATWKRFEFGYIKKADRVITVTEEAAQYYAQETAEPMSKFCVVPNTVRKSFYTDHVMDEKIISAYKDSFTVLYLGDTGLRRGLLTVFEALPYLVPEIPNIKIVVVGKSKEDHILKGYVAENQHEKYVAFEGWQNFSLFPSYIAAADIGICPIHRNLHHDTTYANKIFQYMAFGKPIVVSDCTSQENLVKKYNCGLVFTEQNPRDFADKVLALAKDENYYQEISANASKAIQDHLNWSITSRNLQELYKEENQWIKK